MMLMTVKFEGEGDTILELQKMFVDFASKTDAISIESLWMKEIEKKNENL
jgi:hypothetical protein